jgi:glycosyltransferase involved in cell wall biosynthesis
MIFHVISTVNGEENEGMRNVATHIIRELEQSNTVISSSLHDLSKFPHRCKRADCTLIFARCIPKIYYVARLCSIFSKNIFLFVVQKPDKKFISLLKKHPLRCNYFAACDEDIDEVEIEKSYSAYNFNIGINTEKFCSVNKGRKIELRKRYGLDLDKPLVVHVGHCSVGRGLEDFCGIDPAKFQRLVVASGMFDNSIVISTLEQAGIDLYKGYLPNINEIYQMADVYFFPTQNDDFVISVPLSVMEALACGVPTLAYSSFSKLRHIKCASESIKFIDGIDEINEALETLIQNRNNTSFLKNAVSWKQVTAEIYKTITEVIR